MKNINLPKGAPLPADRAYGDNQTREPAVKLELIPVIPPGSTRKQPWKYGRYLYRKRNGVEGLFRRIKRFRRVFTRYDKLDIIYTGFFLLAFIYDALLCINTPSQSTLSRASENRNRQIFADCGEYLINFVGPLYAGSSIPHLDIDNDLLLLIQQRYRSASSCFRGLRANIPDVRLKSTP